jgi:replicative DNA helicase
VKQIAHPEAELSLLAGLMSGSTSKIAAAEIYATVHSAAFSDRKLAHIFGAMLGLYRCGDDPTDARHVVARLEHTGNLEAAGGAENVNRVDLYAGTGADVRYWSRLVREYYRRRELARVYARALAVAQDTTRDLDDALAEVGSEISAVTAGRDDLGSSSLGEAAADEIVEISRRYSDGEGQVGVKSGFAGLDRLTGGFQPGEVTLLAGRPKMGKTSLALAFACNAARAGKTLMLFSHEMSRRALCHRLIAMRSGVACYALRAPKTLTTAEMGHLDETGPELRKSAAAIRFVSKPRLNVVDIRAAAQICQLTHGLDLVMVDYLQRIPPVRRGHNREREVAEISDELGGIAKDLEVPMLCLAQLGRGVEQRANHIPNMSDLRESGALEQDADVILFVHREAEYVSNPTEKANLADRGTIYVGKNRNGPEGAADVKWCARRTLFHEEGGLL